MPRKKNILFLPTWYPIEKNSISGIFCKDQVEALAKHLTDFNFFVTLWGQDLLNFNYLKPASFLGARNKLKQLPPPSIEKIEENLFNVHRYTIHANMRLGGLKTIEQSLKQMVYDIEKEFGKIELIHSHVSYPGGYLAYRLAKFLNIPYIVQEHMAPFPFEHLLKNGKLIHQMQTALDESFLNLAVSEDLKNQIQKHSNNRVQVLPNVVNEDLFKPKASKKLVKNNEDFFTFFTLAGMTQRKGIDFLLKSIALIKDYKFKHIIAGKGELFTTYQEMAKNLKIDHIVEWVKDPNLNQKIELYQKCDAFILTSHYETFGVVYAEAMACGKPVIGHGSGGPKTVITSETGVLIDKMNTKLISDAMMKLIQNQNSYDATQIRQSFLNRFSSDQVAKRALSIYQSILEK